MIDPSRMASQGRLEIVPQKSGKGVMLYLQEKGREGKRQMTP